MVKRWAVLVAMILYIVPFSGCSSTKGTANKAPAGGSKCNCERMKHLKQQNSYLYRK